MIGAIKQVATAPDVGVSMHLARSTNKVSLASLLLPFLLATAAVHAQANLVSIDATSPDTPETAVAAKLGTARIPGGHTLGVTSQNLLLDGKPWLPVMGEMHYSRVPEGEWEPDILRMKSAGVNIISTYVIWVHHEQVQGQFVWTGDKDLRRFAELCAKHGMYLYPRIGPWAHAEVRHGGLPDWVAALPHTRENDPQYLADVDTFYRQIGQQLKGLYWKDGGPVIGVQIENEYRATGPGKGSEHIRTLKAMAIAAGMDVPLYTVTGWDGAAVPLDAALPVFGGYPDAPWGDDPKPLPPPEIYAFRFDNRSSGNMGAIGGSGQGPASAYRGTPFLTAEVGGGIEDTYFRRPVVSADDIAATVPVMLGSGANLIGYYMFVGGRNPDGGAITLQESQRTGYPTDVPVKAYDFQAPIGNNGEERESLRRLKLVHYFLNDFGAQLAPMRVHRPQAAPASAQDLGVPRVSARTHGDSGFLFFNNHTRGAAMPARPGFQVQLMLPGGTVQVPQQPITLPSEAYGIWPVNLNLSGVNLRYSTAQLMSRLDRDDEVSVFFFGLPGVVPEFLVDAPTSAISAHGFAVSHGADGVKLQANAASGDILVRTGTRPLHLILMSRDEAEDTWKVNDGRALLRTKADVYSDGPRTTLEQEQNNVFDFSLLHAATTVTASPHVSPKGDLFTAYRSSVPQVSVSITAKETAKAGIRSPLKDGPPVSWRKASIPMAPEDAEFAQAARWSLALHGDVRAPQLEDVLVRIRYQGDVARLRQGGLLRDDDFWNGLPWTFATQQLGLNAKAPMALEILPLPPSYPMFLQNSPEATNPGNHGKAVSLQSVQAIPLYRYSFNAQPD